MAGIFQTLLGSLAGVVKDTFFKYVTLLLPGNGANGAQNNTFIDASTNNFSITRNGNTTQGTFTPFGDNWSNYFDGAGDYLAAPSNAAFNFSTGDYCLEAWVYLTAHGTGPSGAYSMIFSSSGVNNYWAVLSTGGNVWLQAYDGSTAPQQSSGSQLQLNTWNHVAYVKNSGNFSMYLNGTSVYSATLASSWGATAAFNIGASPTSYSGFYFVNGYVSNARVVKGSPVYTSNFTPSTTPLTAITNTSLLTCQSNRFIDNSTNAFTITRNGDVSVQRFSPFSPTAAYSASVIGGSGYFDGTGDYLSVADNAALQLGGGNWTIECWVNGGPQTNKIILSKGNNSGSHEWLLYINTLGNISFAYNLGTQFILSSLPLNNTWQHIVVVNVGTTVTLYVNGTSVGTAGVALTNGNNNLGVGAYASGGSEFAGYISSYRLVKGTAVYTSNFIPPTTPPTAITNTSLLLNFTNAGIIDNAMLNNLETVGGAQISTAQSKFGGSSMYFDGTGDYLVSNPASTDLYAFGSGDFTIEMWVYFAGVASIQGLYDSRPASTQGAYPLLYLNSDGTIRYFVSSSDRITSSAVSSATWYHVAVSRSGTSTRMFVNGTQAGSTYTDSTTYLNSSGRPWIGVNAFSTSQFLNGYIDDLRITKGVARYTANFTPPAAAFPTS